MCHIIVSMVSYDLLVCPSFITEVGVCWELEGGRWMLEEGYAMHDAASMVLGARCMRIVRRAY